MNGGYYVIKVNGDCAYQRATNRTGQQRLSKVEKLLRQTKVEFVEDFESDSIVVVRYGDLVHDVMWKMYDERGSTLGGER